MRWVPRFSSWAAQFISETSTSTSPTPNPTPTPTVPELQTWTIPLLLSLIIATAGLLVYHKKHKKDLVQNP